MNRSCEFLGKGGIDRPLTVEPGFTGEGLGDNQDVEMAFPAVRRAGMSGVRGRFVGDLEPHRLERGPQLCCNPVVNFTHDHTPVYCRLNR